MEILKRFKAVGGSQTIVKRAPLTVGIERKSIYLEKKLHMGQGVVGGKAEKNNWDRFIEGLESPARLPCSVPVPSPTSTLLPLLLGQPPWTGSNKESVQILRLNLEKNI